MQNLPDLERVGRRDASRLPEVSDAQVYDDEFGRMPLAVAQQSMRLFAREVFPVVRSWPDA